MRCPLCDKPAAELIRSMRTWRCFLMHWRCRAGHAWVTEDK